MTRVKVLYWKDIPSVVEARDKTGTKKVQLSLKFMELIDLIAMRQGLVGSDDYLSHWNKKPQNSSELSAEEAAQQVADLLESDYDEIRNNALKSIN